MKTILIILLSGGMQLAAQTQPEKATKKIDTVNTTLQESKKLPDQIPVKQNVTMESIEAEKRAQFPEGYYEVPKDVSGKDKNMIGGTPK